MADSYDLLVIGAGSAGLSAARFARRLGLTVALVEKDRVGGDCTWTGCVPSKALLRAAGVSYDTRTARRFGLTTVPPVETDFHRVMSRVRRTIAEIYQAESPDALGSEGIDVVVGEARFLDSRTVDVAGRNLTARRFIICTGARPIIPNIPGLKDVPFLTYETVWDLQRPPQHLVVVGGGPIGCELAQAFLRLGSAVTLVEAADRLLPQEEPEASDLLAGQLVSEGLDLRLATGLVSASREGDGISLSLTGGVEEHADAVLLAVGRRAYLEGLDLDRAGIRTNHAGVVVDRNLCTSRRHIYAAGDCTSGLQFTHYAAYQGFMAVRNAFLPMNGRGIPRHTPRVTFTGPEVAQVGMTEAQANDRYGTRVAVTDWPMGSVDRAVVDGRREGLIKLVHLPNGKLLGATVVAPRAGEMVHEWSLALDHGLKLSDVAASLHAYPTYSIANQQAAVQFTVDRMLSGRSGRLLRKLAQGFRSPWHGRTLA